MGGGNKKSAPSYGPTQAEINRLADRYVKDTQADIGPYLKSISNFGDRLTAKVDDLIKKGAVKMGAEEATLLGRLDNFNQKLIEFQKTQNTDLLKDLGGINDDFQSAMDLLDDTDKAEFKSSLENFQKKGEELITKYDDRATAEVDRGFTDSKKELDQNKADRLADVERTKAEEFAQTEKFGQSSESLADEFRRAGDASKAESLAEADQRAADGRSVISNFDSETKALTEGFKTESSQINNQFAADNKSLGETYLSMDGQSIGDYNSRLETALNLSPERLVEFTQAADFLANEALQTRMKMLATADPRALELAAIVDENAAAMMSGRISADVQANLGRSSAMRALSGGFGAGGEMGRGLAARDLGLTSLDLMKQGTEMNDGQRRLNFATRVQGVAEGAGANAGQLLSNDQTLRRNQASDMLTAETNRNRTFFDVGQRGLSSEADLRSRSALNYLDQSRTSLTERQRSELDQLNKVGDVRQSAFLQDRVDNRGIYDARGAANSLMLGSNLATIRYGAERTDNTLNTTLAGNLANIGTRTNQNLGIAKDIFASGQDINRLGFASEQDNLAQRTRRQADTAINIYGQNFAARTNIYSSDIATGRSIYGTNAQSVGNIYNTNTSFIRDQTGNLINTAATIYGGDSRARENAFNKLNAARGSATGMKATAAQNAFEVERANWASSTENNNSMWSSLIQTGATIGGQLIGTALTKGNPAGGQVGGMIGAQVGSSITGGGGSSNSSSGGGTGGGIMGMFTSALGSRNAGGFDSQWGMYGKSPAGFGNFDYGSGTGA